MHEMLQICKKIIKPLVPANLRRKIRCFQQQLIVKPVIHARHTVTNARYEWGVALIGDMHCGSGLGEASRANSQCLKYAQIPTQEVPMTNEELSEFNSPYAVMLIHTNPDQLNRVCSLIPKSQWTNRYIIGEWVWEQEKLPDWWLPYIELFDEIWTPSEFAANAIRRVTEKTVRILPHAVEPQFDESWGRSAFGLPDGLFLCLITFDYHSVLARKNPEGAINAFCKAFCNCRTQVGLVLKTRNTPPEILRELRTRLNGWPNVYFLTEDYSKNQVNSLIRAVDVYISLHRAEGFGLVLAEAMYLGTPVVATNWSGNTEFMNSEVACMVDAAPQILQKDELPFLKGSRWAEPDENQAAEFLRKLFDQPEWRTEIAARAKEYISTRLSVQSISEQMDEYLTEIRENYKL